MRRSTLVTLVVLVPVLLFANVFQAYRYTRLEQRLRVLERDQSALIEENKRAILAITVLSGPDRVGDLARGELGLERIEPDQVIRLSVPGSGARE